MYRHRDRVKDPGITQHIPIVTCFVAETTGYIYYCSLLTYTMPYIHKVMVHAESEWDIKKVRRLNRGQQC